VQRRLLWSYLSITAFVLLILEIPLGVSYSNSVERRMESDLQHYAFALAIRTQEPLDALAAGTGTAEKLQDLALDYQHRAGGRVVIVDAQGRAVADSQRAPAPGARPDFSNRPEVADALAGSQVSGIRWSKTLGADLLYVALPVGAADGVQGAVRITNPASVVSDRIREIWLLLAATGGVVLGIVFLVSQLLARSITRPLGDLRGTAGRLGAGDLTVRADVPKGPAEVAELAESFNVTAARLEQLVRAQQGFVADASHQLRTPLAALRLRLEILEADAEGEVADDLEGARLEVDRLSRLVDGLLALARAEQAPSAPAPVLLADVVAGRCEAWDAFATERRVQIRSSVPQGAWASATPGRLEQVVDNLLNNALEVAPAGSVVDLDVLETTDRVEMVVSDEGPGMPTDDRARAFDRFWQSGEARRHGRPDGHVGLGLAIVRELVTGDGGEVVLEDAHAGSARDRGLAVTVRMRRAEAPDPARTDPAPGTTEREPGRPGASSSEPGPPGDPGGPGGPGGPGDPGEQARQLSTASG
jgi:signal transduction histidine kinase